MTQSALSKANKERMVMYDPENAYAWQQIMEKVRELYANGHTQLSISKIFGVSRDTVGRWLSEERGGERTTFGAMLRYAKALDIPYENLIREHNEQSTTKQTVTPYDATLKSVLADFAHDNDLTIPELAKKTALPAAEVNAVFNEEIPASPTIIRAICSTIEVGESMVFKRATKKLEEEQSTDSTANAAHSA